MVRISRREFASLVLQALDSLPQAIQSRIDNVDVVVVDWPTRNDLDESGLTDRRQLLGLYQGIPLTEREHYDMALPDKITIFRRPIEAACHSRKGVVTEVRATVIHEVAHHFGIDDDRLEELGV